MKHYFSEALEIKYISPDSCEELLIAFEARLGDISTWAESDYWDFVEAATGECTEDVEFDEKMFLIKYGV